MAIFLAPGSPTIGPTSRFTHSVYYIPQSRHFSILNRPLLNCLVYVPLTRIEKVKLAVASAFLSLLIPRMSGEISCAPIWSLMRIKIMFTKPQPNATSPGLPPRNLDQINHNVLCNLEALLTLIAMNEKPPIGLTLTEFYYPP
jgi:hypothetical protein